MTGPVPPPGPPPGPPYAFQYAPPHLPPPKPEVPLRHAWWWTCVFSFVGAVLVVAVVAVVLVVVFLLFASALAAVTETLTVRDVVEEAGLGGALTAGLYFAVMVLLASVVSVVASTGMLLLLRLARDFRTWRPALQGLSAAVATYVVGSGALAALGRVSDLLG